MKKTILSIIFFASVVYALTTIIKVKNYVIYTQTDFTMNPEYVHNNLFGDYIDTVNVPKGMYHYWFSFRNGSYGGLYIDYYHINADTVGFDSLLSKWVVNYTIDTSTVDSTQQYPTNWTSIIPAIYLDTLGQFNIGMRAVTDSCLLQLTQIKIL